MADKRDQHFVPRSYLKYFSENNLISLYNFNDEKIIKKVPYASHCSENYYYGKNEIEDMFGAVEAEFGLIKLKLFNKDVITEYEYVMLLLYVYTQIVRTPKQICNFNVMIEDLFSEISIITNNDNNSYKQTISPENFVRKNPLLFFCLFDLKFITITNETEVSFITSDNPVALYNQYYKNEFCFNCTGLQHKGLIVYLPLNPKLAILLYDSETYCCLENNILIKRIDVDCFNRLQIVNSNNQLFFPPSQETNFNKYDKNIEKTIKQEAIHDSYNNKHYFYIPNPKLNFNEEVSFLTINKKLLDMSLEERKPELREYWKSRPCFFK